MLQQHPSDLQIPVTLRCYVEAECCILEAA